MLMIDFVNELRDSHQRVDEAISRYLLMFLKKDVSLLMQAIRYSVLLGGKRLRPFLVYQTGKLFGIRSSNLNAPAAAIECIHAYSLIHDDLPIMDNDKLRRGHPTCHVKFGESIAVLAGDALHTLAFTILSEAHMPTVTDQNRLKMIATLASASGANGMCLGQSLDLISKNNKNISATQLETIYQYKTGSLIRAAVRIGALAAGNKSKSCDDVLSFLDHYATTIGLAFQIQDDIIDISHAYDQKKKHSMQSKHNDVNNTYPKILGLNTARTKAQDLYCESLTSLKYIAKLGYNVNILSAFSRYIIKRNN
ncbi:(2E,6E)-farnesyl diphosphate synthase [Blochmannia endosymbiont of Camponotus modoc]|uniref:(2E,6E)-farnesyl diphosphate synthase n=1 Tax=Blochmannia endosymbiont of Camponotus modoc TaxID=2945587 RepID=UPI0020251A23|nr:(2E,6E)-farnesyl diphosphate synthase [Blochmannia endosymbiont of Camponotus modoc]URJ31986.1 (2E,6E)-farnesyl diphosphate synthase [Blochmannia endosymbiont of Camponotus modoc]